jgi:hypothetical protein
VTEAKVVSAGVKTAVSRTFDATVGSQEQVALNGVTVVVATFSQAAMVLPSALYSTVPAELVVATSESGIVFITALEPPVRIIVAGSAAIAGAILPILNAAITTPARILRISCSFYFGCAITL